MRAIGDGAILIRVRAAGVKPIDGKVRDGYVGADGAPRFPLVLGTDAAGVVERVGLGVERVGLGDAVFAVCVKPESGDGCVGRKGHPARSAAMSVASQRVVEITQRMLCAHR